MGFDHGWHMGSDHSLGLEAEEGKPGGRASRAGMPRASSQQLGQELELELELELGRQPPGLVPCAPVLPPPLPAAPLPAAPGGEDVQSRLGACPYPVAVCREPLWLQGSPFPAAGT